MVKMLASALALSLVAPVAVEASAVGAMEQRHGGFAARREGTLSIREIERRVIPRMPNAQYLGFDFDGDSAIYTLKFLRDGNVIWVEVDGRSGQVLGRSGR